MRLPTKVNICDKSYEVRKNNKNYNSGGETFKQRITISVKGQGPERVFDNYLHEVAEVVTCEQKLRFTASDDEVVFVMTHKQFDRFVSSVAAALHPMVK